MSKFQTMFMWQALAHPHHLVYWHIHTTQPRQNAKRSIDTKQFCPHPQCKAHPSPALFSGLGTFFSEVTDEEIPTVIMETNTPKPQRYDLALSLKDNHQNISKSRGYPFSDNTTT